MPNQRPAVAAWDVALARAHKCCEGAVKQCREGGSEHNTAVHVASRALASPVVGMEYIRVTAVRCFAVGAIG